jgi:L-malate glycosyltransferase
LKILHISYWYPTEAKPNEALWIKKHINSIKPYSDTNVVLHLEIKPASGFKFTRTYLREEIHHIVEIPLSSWFIIEWMTSITLLYYFYKLNVNRFDLVNFHIAYPNCTHFRYFQRWIKQPVIITEHWSGFHYNFNIQNPKKRKRIQRIFHSDYPVIAVSDALAKDIKEFTGASFPWFIIPNIVDTNVFKYHPDAENDKTPIFLMVSQWKWPKDSFTVIKTWENLIRDFPSAELRIGGYGEQWEEMQRMIIDLQLAKNIKLLGLLTPEDYARELRVSTAFIHCSAYETFSVVCAEALCCGTPVIASMVGGIPEYVHSGNGILVTENNPEAFYAAIISFLERKVDFDKENISSEAIGKFSEETVGRQYFSVLKKLVAD